MVHALLSICDPINILKPAQQGTNSFNNAEMIGEETTNIPQFVNTTALGMSYMDYIENLVDEPL